MQCRTIIDAILLFKLLLAQNIYIYIYISLCLMFLLRPSGIVYIKNFQQNICNTSPSFLNIHDLASNVSSIQNCNTSASKSLLLGHLYDGVKRKSQPLSLTTILHARRYQVAIVYLYYIYCKKKHRLFYNIFKKIKVTLPVMLLSFFDNNSPTSYCKG